MLAAVVRSGVVEAEHHGAVAIVNPAGDVVASSGDIERRFFGRSCLKPFQAQVGLELGSGLSRAHLAITCASHPATPTHVAFVLDVLRRAGLSEGYLQTPPALPSGAGLRFVDPNDEPRPIWHNCSGKHAGMLAACSAAGLDTETYLNPAHPLQLAVADLVSEVTGEPPGPVGVDGCGAPVLETTVAGIARAFMRLAQDNRFDAIRTAMHGHPRLIGDAAWIDANVMVWVNGVAKGGAEGLLGIGLPAGYGIAVKSWDGSERGVWAGAVAALRALGFLDERSYQAKLGVVLGGGVPSGSVEPMLTLAWA